MEVRLLVYTTIANIYQPFVYIGLSPTIHVLDQIRIIDRFKGNRTLEPIDRECCQLKRYIAFRNTT